MSRPVLVRSRLRALRAALALGLLSSLLLAGGAPAETLVTNPGARIEGITPAARSVEGDEVAASGRSRAARAAPGAGIEARTVLVLRVHYADEGWPSTASLEGSGYSASEIQDRVTAATGSARAMYAAQSNGQVTFTGAASAAADVAPWFDFSGTFPRTSGQCDHDAAREQAKTEATARSIP